MGKRQIKSDSASNIQLLPGTTGDVVVKDGTGNLRLFGDFTLNNTEDSISLIFSSVDSVWKDISRSDNGA